MLESPVDAAGLDPLYLDSVAALRRTLPAICRSSCDSFTSDVVADTARLVERLAAEPLRGRIVDPRGHARTASLTRQELLYALIAGDDGLVGLPTYPAAMASALRGDTAPILRLERRATARPAFLVPRITSTATHAATICEEVRFPWSWNATPAERDEAAYRTEAAMDPSLAAPFDPATLVRSDLMRLCRRWPTASSAPPPEPGAMPDVPALVIATPEAARASLESARRTAARFPRGRLLETPRVVQLFGSARGTCADRAVERFLVGRRVQDRCPRQAVLPPVSPSPRALSQLAPVAGAPGAARAAAQRGGRELRRPGGQLLSGWIPRRRPRRVRVRDTGRRPARRQLRGRRERVPPQPLGIRARCPALRPLEYRGGRSRAAAHRRPGPARRHRPVQGDRERAHFPGTGPDRGTAGPRPGPRPQLLHRRHQSERLRWRGGPAGLARATGA